MLVSARVAAETPSGAGAVVGMLLLGHVLANHQRSHAFADSLCLLQLCFVIPGPGGLLLLTVRPVGSWLRGSGKIWQRSQNGKVKAFYLFFNMFETRFCPTS